MGGPQEETHQIVTPDGFQTHVAWHGVNPFYQGEATAFGAGNEGEDDEETIE